jgi:hypothetical protein
MAKPAAVAMACFVISVAAASGQIAGADPVDDGTAALQAKFDALKPGDALTLEPRTYRHSGIVYLRVPGVRINGNGATLQSTNDPTSAVQIKADGISVSNLNLTAPSNGPRYDGTDQHSIVVAGNGVNLSDITITGSAAAGVYVAGSNFKLDRVTVRDTRADGIQMSAGASNGQVNNATTERTGDDGIAVVSYTERLLGYHVEPCRNIVIDSPVINGTTQARGITVAGAENISIRNIRVSQTSSAGVFITSIAAPIYTQPTTGVEVLGGTVSQANVYPGLPMGAVEVSSEQGGSNISHVTISNLTVVDTPQSAQRNLAVEVSNGGTLDNIAFRNIQIQQQTDLPAFASNAPRDSYTASGVTMNGQAIDIP